MDAPAPGQGPRRSESCHSLSQRLTNREGEQEDQSAHDNQPGKSLLRGRKTAHARAHASRVTPEPKHITTATNTATHSANSHTNATNSDSRHAGNRGGADSAVEARQHGVASGAPCTTARDVERRRRTRRIVLVCRTPHARCVYVYAHIGVGVRT